MFKNRPAFDTKITPLCFIIFTQSDLLLRTLRSHAECFYFAESKNKNVSKRGDELIILFNLM